MPSYLRQRRRGYYARVRVPPSLKHVLGHAIEVSLKTRDPKVAERLKHAVVGKIKERIEAARLADAVHKTTSPTERLLAQAVALREALQAGGVITSDSDGEGEVISLQLDKLLEDFVSAHGYHLDSAGHPVMPHEAEQAVKQAFTLVTRPDSHLLGPTIDVYLNEIEKRILKQTYNSKQRHLYAFRDWIGAHTDITAVTRANAGRYLTAKIMPQAKSVKTKQEQVINLSSFFKWTMQRGMVDMNAFAGQVSTIKDTVRGVEAKRRPWSAEELQRLLSGLTGELRTLAVLGLYTGCRLNELCELEVKNVKDDRLCIVAGKRQASVRDIPLHTIIKPLVERLREASTDWYLVSGLKRSGEDMKRSKRASADFGIEIRRLGLEDKALVFHSLRNTFENALERAGVPVTTAELLTGHKRKSMSYGRYSPGLPLGALREAVDKVTFGAEVDALAAQ